MGNKISALPAATSVGASDLIPIVQGGVTKSATQSLVNPNVSGTAQLATQTTVTGSFATIGELSITLPSAGTYLIAANVSYAITASAGGDNGIAYKFFNTTDSADIVGSYGLIYSSQNGVSCRGTSHVSAIYTASGAKTITLQAEIAAGTFSQALILKDSGGAGSALGQSILLYVKLY